MSDPGGKLPERKQAGGGITPTPQEQNLLEHHRDNLWGPGPIIGPEGEASTLLQAVVPGPGGRYYSIPTVWGGQALDVHSATQQAAQEGWDKWPSYRTPEEADWRYGYPKMSTMVGEGLHGIEERDLDEYQSMGGLGTPERKQAGGGAGLGSMTPQELVRMAGPPPTTLFRSPSGFSMREEPMPMADPFFNRHGYGYGVGQTDPALRPPPQPPGPADIPPEPSSLSVAEVARQAYAHPLPVQNMGPIERSSETPRQTMARIQGDPSAPQPEGQAQGGQIHYQKPSSSFRKEHPITSQGPQSAQQRRLVWATVHGADTGMPAAVAERFARSDAPGKLPKYVGKRQEGGGVGFGTEPGDSLGLGARPRLQAGGMTSADMPYWTRSEFRSIEDQPHGGGLIASSGAGRTDQLPLAVPVESHVIPAQEIAGLGQGNSMSGSRIMSTALSIGPWGIQPLRGVRGHGVPMPSPPRPTRFDAGGELDEGGARHETSILAAGGEYIVPRDDWLQLDEHGQLHVHAGVRTVGEGDIAKGHERLNQMIKNIRNHTIKFLRSAPPPKS